MSHQSYSYDVMQYDSYPYKYTHPNHLYTLATLFGLNPKPFLKSRVLELGCASGGNLIPMAFSASQSQFVGVDLSVKQIEKGKKIVNALGLKNIDLRHQSILDFKINEGYFDYIICHGIYSWVDQITRDKIMKICKNNLSPNGVAFVSYNTLPGWNMVRSIREIMQYHVAGVEDPHQKAKQARSILQFIVSGIKEQKTAYSNFLESEINILSNQSDNYLLHDHLEEENHPVYFHEFISHARKHQLNYLSDTDISQMYPANLPNTLATEISKITDIERLGQYMDFVRNQRFRQTILCHQDITINRKLHVEQLKKYHFKYQGVILGDEGALNVDGAQLVFKGQLITLTLDQYYSKIAMYLLAQQKKPITYHQWKNIIIEYLTGVDEERIEKVLNEELNLLRLVLGGLIVLSTDNTNYTVVPGPNPKATALARQQLLDSSFVTNQRHEVVRLNPIEKMLLGLCDGALQQSSLGQALADKVIAHQIPLYKEDGSVITCYKEISRRSEYLFKDILASFAQNALLV